MSLHEAETTRLAVFGSIPGGVGNVFRGPVVVEGRQ